MHLDPLAEPVEASAPFDTFGRAQRIAWFITPHGFGHATRASAIMAAIARMDPTVRFEIFTRVPRWLFKQSLDAPFGYHETLTDIGLVQQDALHEDIPATLQRLDAFLPFDTTRVNELAAQVRQLGCALVVCDIAPLGIAVAQAAGLPSVLVENFTWDWIYAGYAQEFPQLLPHMDTLREWIAQATHHIQTEPVCQYTRHDLLTAPVSRAPRRPAAEVRQQLGVPLDARMVLITMGGVPGAEQHDFLHRLVELPNIWFVIPGGNAEPRTEVNVILLPNQSAFYHPDIMNAADMVVGKSGYSTVAEAYQAGIPYGYVSRARFRESDIMAAYIRAHLGGFEISADDFASGAWLIYMSDFSETSDMLKSRTNGADQAASYILGIE